MKVTYAESIWIFFGDDNNNNVYTQSNDDSSVNSVYRNTDGPTRYEVGSFTETNPCGIKKISLEKHIIYHEISNNFYRENVKKVAGSTFFQRMQLFSNKNLNMNSKRPIVKQLKKTPFPYQCLPI